MKQSVGGGGRPRILDDFDPVDEGHSHDGNEGEDNLSLGGGADAGEAAVDGSAFSSRRCQDVEVFEQGDSVGVDVEDVVVPPLAGGVVAAAVVAFAELERQAVATVGDGDGVGEAAPALAGVERGFLGNGASIAGRISGTDECVASQEI